LEIHDLLGFALDELDRLAHVGHRAIAYNIPWLAGGGNGPVAAWKPAPPRLDTPAERSVSCRRLPPAAPVRPFGARWAIREHRVLVGNIVDAMR
jgi:hypothetical protein